MIHWTDGPQPHYFGEMYQTNNAVATTINTVDVWEQIVNFSEGLVEGVTVASSAFTVPKDGKIQVFWGGSTAAAGVNKTFEIAPSKNDVMQLKGPIGRKYSTVDIGASAGPMVLDVVAGDVIKLEIRNITDNTDVTVQNCNFEVHYM